MDDQHRWVDDLADIDWDELSELYRVAPLGDKPPDALRTVFSNSMFVRFVYAGDRLVGAGRALADGLDCAYIADVAVHPDHQGTGLGQAIIRRGKGLKKQNAALFQRIEARYGVPAGPLLAIWGMETGFGGFLGKEHTLSAVATLAYDCRRPEYFTNQLYAALQLVQNGTLSPDALRYLAAAVRARRNILISGGTGSGKTTLLNALSSYVGPKERIVTIEDTAELRLQMPHVVRLETRPASIEGVREISARDLLRNALRMRPDRIILGEVRSHEAIEVLQAMGTGHDGSMATIHANGTADALERLEMLMGLYGFSSDLQSVRRFIVSAVDIVVQTARGPTGRRSVSNIVEITGIEGNHYTQREIHAGPELAARKVAL